MFANQIDPAGSGIYVARFSMKFVFEMHADVVHHRLFLFHFVIAFVD